MGGPEINFSSSFRQHEKIDSMPSIFSPKFYLKIFYICVWTKKMQAKVYIQATHTHTRTRYPDCIQITAPADRTGCSPLGAWCSKEPVLPDAKASARQVKSHSVHLRHDAPCACPETSSVGAARGRSANPPRKQVGGATLQCQDWFFPRGVCLWKDARLRAEKKQPETNWDFLIAPADSDAL